MCELTTNPMKVVIDRDDIRYINQEFKNLRYLTRKEKIVLTLRFGLVSGIPMSSSDVVKELVKQGFKPCTKQNVFYIQSIALKKLRLLLTAINPDDCCITYKKLLSRRNRQ